MKLANLTSDSPRCGGFQGRVRGRAREDFFAIGLSNPNLVIDANFCCNPLCDFLASRHPLGLTTLTEDQ